MNVEILNQVQELENTEPFQVDCLLWGTKAIPKTYGYLGFVPGDGFYLKMICEESDPMRTYTADQDPVYQDSAMEAFFMFESEQDRTGRLEAPVYLNFEVNANGAMMAGYGKERIYRSYFPKETMQKFACRTEIRDDSWSLELRIPTEVLEEIYGPLHLGAGSRFSCNFYKLSETAKIEHYASYSPIRTEIPSFHLPEFFASAQIVERGI